MCLTIEYKYENILEVNIVIRRVCTNLVQFTSRKVR